jgi:small-conductance mechanosensitive channel
MSHLKIILTSIFGSVVISTFITLALVSSLNPSYLPQHSTETSVDAPSAAAEIQPEEIMDPLEVEFQSLSKHNEEIAEQLAQYEFSDPRHAALLQELDAVNKQIEENIAKRKSN